MATIAQTNPPREGIILPADLSIYIGKKTLVKLILDARAYTIPSSTMLWGKRR